MTYFSGRCIQHRPKGRKRNYSAYVEPLGEPGTLICGRFKCDNPAVIWLDEEEQAAYENDGKRIFHGATNVVRVRAADSGLKKR
jgi:hypothetical protein